MSDVTVLPYGGRSHPNSGHSGSSTSEARAVTEDSDGTTTGRQQWVLERLHQARDHGLTVAEVRHLTGWHHGQASAALSNLHKAGRIFRLTEVRGKCKVYVGGPFINGRDVEVMGATAITALLDQAIEAWRKMGSCPLHSPLPESECAHCMGQESVARYDNMKGTS